jgi:hypothetical protein
LDFNNQHDYLTKLFSAGVTLFEAAPDGRVGQFLTQLFSQAAGSPTAYPVIHKEMIGAWPEETNQIGSYGPSQILERAVQFIEQHPAVTGIEFVFDSIVDLVEHNLVTENIYPRVAKAIVILWPHSPSSVSKCSGKVIGLLSPTDVREILTGNQPEDQIAELETIVNFIVDQFTEEKCMKATREILSVNPIQINTYPDGALSMWLKALGSDESPIIDKLLQEDGLNEAQKERLYQHAVNRKDELGLQFFMIVLPRALGNPAEQGVLDVAIRTAPEIADLAETDDNRAALCNQIIPELPNLSGQHLAEIARLIRNLGCKGSLERNTKIINEIDSKDLSIIVEEFPDSKKLRQSLEARSE